MESVREEIERLKKEKKAAILAHYYQLSEVLEIADYIGDSYELSQKSGEIEADIIVFCGVRFMAESGAILSSKEVLLPVEEAGCPLADSITVEDLHKLKREHPGVKVVSYVNTSAQIKAESHVCCTSANAVKIVNGVEGEQVIFVPDGNLAYYVAQKTEKKIIPWGGSCPPHSRIKEEDIHEAKRYHPEAKILVHPESPPAVVDRADFVGGTGAILREVKISKAKVFFIGTELGLLHQLKKENPDKIFMPLNPDLYCKDMKMTTLRDVLISLQEHRHRITLDSKVKEKALLALNRMLEMSGPTPR